MQCVFMRTTKNQIRPRGCTGWLESSFGAVSEGTSSNVAVPIDMVEFGNWYVNTSSGMIAHNYNTIILSQC